MSIPGDIRGVFFDLDGTLLDSAPDLYAALSAQCAEEGVTAPPYVRVRQVVSRGSLAILRCAFSAFGEAGVAARVPHFLALYQAQMARQTKPFAGVETLLAGIETRGWPWGIVTNKPGFLADDLVQRIGWGERSCTVVAGDTLPVKKPDPAPVLLACTHAGVAPAQAVFVGDDSRDIQAGRDAGLVTVAAAWGYLDGGDPRQWGADVVLDTPEALHRWLQGASVPA